MLKDKWIYGTCHERPARKHKKNGNVQFVLWKAGEQCHAEDYWHNFDSYWWPQFKEQEQKPRAINHLRPGVFIKESLSLMQGYPKYKVWMYMPIAYVKILYHTIIK